MKKQPTTYTPLAAHLIRDNIGGQVSLIATLPDGTVVQGYVMAGLPPALFERYDVQAQPPGAPEFETAQVFTLTPKNAAPRLAVGVRASRVSRILQQLEYEIHSKD